MLLLLLTYIIIGESQPFPNNTQPIRIYVDTHAMQNDPYSCYTVGQVVTPDGSTPYPINIQDSAPDMCAQCTITDSTLTGRNAAHVPYRSMPNNCVKYALSGF